MQNIKSDAMPILAEVCMEENDGDVVQSFKEIKEIDDLLGIVKAKSLLNLSRGRKSKSEHRFNEIFRARLLAASEERRDQLKQTLSAESSINSKTSISEH